LNRRALLLVPLVLVFAAGAIAQTPDVAIQRMQTAAEADDRAGFKAALADAKRSGAPARLLDVYDALDRIWDYAETSPTGAFFDRDLLPLVARFAGYEDFIASHVIVDARGNRFYPARETRQFLTKLASRLPAAPNVVIQPPPTALPPAVPAAAARAGGVQISFHEAVDRAMKLSPDDRTALRQALIGMQRVNAGTLPAVRALADLRSSRTHDVLGARPLDVQAASTSVSVDYTLFDRHLLGVRREEAAAEVQYFEKRVATNRELFERVLGAYADAYGLQQRKQLLTTVLSTAEKSDADASQLLENGEISLITAATSHESLLTIRGRLLDLELQRLTAVSKLKELIGDTGAAEIVTELATELDASEREPLQRDAVIAALTGSDVTVASLEREVGRSRLALEEANARRKPRTDLYAFVGVEAARSNFAGVTTSSTGAGIYGVHLGFSYPLLDRAPQLDAASAELELKRNEERLAAARAAAQMIAEHQWQQYIEAGRRVALLVEWSRVEREREGSLRRLIDAGVRRDVDLTQAVGDRALHDEELLAARVQRWRLYELLRFPQSAL
jgi:outer membrane protein TolC